MGKCNIQCSEHAHDIVCSLVMAAVGISSLSMFRFCTIQSGFICWTLMCHSSTVCFHHWYRVKEPHMGHHCESAEAISKAHVVQCSHILCEDAFLKVLHNWKWFLSNFFGIHIISNLVHKVRLYEYYYITVFQICIKCNYVLSYQTCHEHRQ
jgi:hypothetical protein